MSENTRVWFTGDTHFGHQRTLELSKRPFKTLEEMNKKMIDNWNEVVQNPIDMSTVNFYREAITKHYDEEVFC